ncbi:hypothetical protein EDB80DRAFT_732530 [Ilyonectria destructans]|nr:hypothetical protein EDB80DRAFT_732530 [Ilyonectria destructans]
MLTNLTFTARRVFTPTLLFKAAACLALLLCMAWFGRLHFYRDPGSVFFDKDRAYETHYSAHRRVEAQQFIDAYVNGTKSYVNGTSQFANNDSGSNKSLCVALSSVKRQTQYLETTIGTLLHGLMARERADLHISVLVAETDPTRHPSWHVGWIRHAVDDFYTYQVNATEKAHLQKLEEAGEYSEKGMFDYAYALQRCYDTGALYVGMFEDDIVMARGWFVRTLLGLRHISDIDKDDKSWLFMRLFNLGEVNWMGKSRHWQQLRALDHFRQGLPTTALSRSIQRAIRLLFPGNGLPANANPAAAEISAREKEWTSGPTARRDCNTQ